MHGSDDDRQTIWYELLIKYYMDLFISSTGKTSNT